MEEERQDKGAGARTGAARLIAINALVALLLLTPLLLPALLALVGLHQARLGRRIPLASDLAQRIYIRDLRAIAQFNPTCFQADPELLYAPRPGSHCRFDNLEFRTLLQFNSLGGRGGESDLRRPELIVVGDSHAMGWGVNGKESVAGHLRASGLATLTLAVSSYGTARELLLLERFARRRPDGWAATRTVVLIYAENDQEENAAFPGRYRPTPASIREYADALERARRLGAGPRPLSAGLLLEPSFLRAALEATPDTIRAQASRSLGRVLPFLARRTRAKLDAESRAAAADLLPVLARHRQLLADRRLVIVVSTSSGLKNASLAQAIGEMLRTEGTSLGLPDTTVIDPLTSCRQECYFVVDDHPNREGHRRMATALVRLIRPQAEPPGGSKASARFPRAARSGAGSPPPSPPPPPAADRRDH